jgi:hypothetical protein
MTLYRHGDVLIFRVEDIPENAKKRAHVVLAYGEITGHSHRIADPRSGATFEYDGQIYLEVIAPTAQLIHEEHAMIELPRGVYRVWQQREYTPEFIRTVTD